MIRRVRLAWPTEHGSPDQPPVRLLAVSDEPEPALDFERNRTQIGKVDAVVGCGDLQPDYLSFLADAFRAPLVYIRGNHDRGDNWRATSEALPHPLSGKSREVPGITLLGLPWPGDTRGQHAVRDDSAAWRQVLPVLVRPPRSRPLIVLSHVPPEGLGDSPEDYYHRGFSAYEMVCRRLHPMLWLHGHTSLAAARDWRVTWGETTLVNVTGAVVVEIAATRQSLDPDEPAPDTIAAMTGAKR